MTIVEFENATKIFGNGTKGLDNVSFQVEEGEFVIIQGKSGAGKTTLVRLMLKEIPLGQGTIRIDGDDISKISKLNTPLLRRKIGVVFQDFKIIAERTVGENIALALDILDLRDDIIDKRIIELLELTGLANKGEMFPAQLSGGELQRVVIARALAPQPKILFADEPTGNLDPETAIKIVHLLQDINSQGTTVLLATHDKVILDNIKGRTIVIENGKITKDSGASSPKKKSKPKDKSEPKEEKKEEEVKDKDKSEPKEDKKVEKEEEQDGEKS